MRVDIDSQNLKADQKYFGLTWPKMGVASLVMGLYLSHILITALLYGLRIVTQLIDLLFYKKKLLELLTCSHLTLTLALCPKKVLF